MIQSPRKEWEKQDTKNKIQATVSVFLTVGSSLDDEGIAGRNSSIPRASGG
jgi:hypothetical protein